MWKVEKKSEEIKFYFKSFLNSVNWQEFWNSSSHSYKIHISRMHMLKEHKLTNFNSERCLCSLCGKTLVGRSNFKKHEREKHGIDNIHRKRIIKELKLECQKCFEGFDDTVKVEIV